MGMQIGITARFCFVTAPWSEGAIGRFHHNISLVALALVIAHPPPQPLRALQLCLRRLP